MKKSVILFFILILISLTFISAVEPLDLGGGMKDIPEFYYWIGGAIVLIIILLIVFAFLRARAERASGV